MQHQYIKDEVCPTCGKDVRSEHFGGTHTNGQRFEEREFRCGCVLEWSPNFSQLIVKRQCPKNPDVVARNQKRGDLIATLCNKIDDHDVDEEFKGKVKRELYRFL